MSNAVAGSLTTSVISKDGKTRRNDRKIVVYGMNYAPEIAGVGKYTGEIGAHLAAEGCDVTVVTTPPHYPGWEVRDGYRNRFSVELSDGVKIFRVPLLLRSRMRGIWRLLAPLSFALTSAPLIFGLILHRRPNTVLSVEPTLFAAPVALLAAKLVGATTVLHVQDLEVDAAFAVGHLGSKTWLKRLGALFERFTMKRFDKIVTISNRMAERIVEKGVPEERVCIVRNWVDLTHIYPLETTSTYRQELGFSENDFVVLYSGNIGAKQGLNVLLDAAVRLKSERSIHFVIAGEGPSKAELQAQYGHLERVHFLPFQPYARFNEFLNMPDLHALPQDRGAADLVLPSKLGGMLASGKRIVVTADKGTELADFVEDAAIIAPPGDVEALADVIRIAASEIATGPMPAQMERVRVLSRDDGLSRLSDTLLMPRSELA
ncbi:WcaI family glycosyltransferase [Neorhizobium sp. NCHU2750]|uniref:WcaI family glycosyltransferase n=1 Tax=Neorhizobium sp. NCHU2750 TaxID=1825976 RepID=UPI000E72D3B7|nr:colanic acid biosynthesis glycosyltransferase WcaI [Neorhizobium sp. NCHU2750]